MWGLENLQPFQPEDFVCSWNQKMTQGWSKDQKYIIQAFLPCERTTFIFIYSKRKDFISKSRRIHSFFRPLFWFGAIHHSAITCWWCVTLIHPYIGNALMIWQAPKSLESCHSHDVLLRDAALIGAKHPGTPQWENYIFLTSEFFDYK